MVWRNLRPPKKAHPAIYGELAPWFHLLTHPKSYAGEARFIVRLLMPPAGARPTMLELGSGGGNRAFHLKKHFDLTPSDNAPRRLTLSRSINPDCEHALGDMRSMRLRRSFDFVFVHDAILYMTSERDLAGAIKTAFVHCKPGATALFQPDCVRETYEAGRKRGGHSDGARKLSCVEQSHPLSTYSPVAAIDFTLKLKRASGKERQAMSVLSLIIKGLACFHARLGCGFCGKRDFARAFSSTRGGESAFLRGADEV